MSVSSRHEVSQARAALGRRLAELRKRAGHTQHSLAPKTLYGRSTIANVELGRQSVGRDFWVRCDDALGTGGVLAAEYDRMQARPPASQPSAALSGPPSAGPTWGTAGGTAPARDASLLHPFDALAPGQGRVLWAPPGRYFSGVGIPVEVYPAIEQDRVLAAVPDRYGEHPFLLAPGCGLVIGRTGNGQLLGLDRRHARRRLCAAAAGARLPIPSAYRLDEVTCAVLWAVANLDHALLADDALLDQCQDHVAGYERMPKSAASRDLEAELSPVGRMWLGSTFCAGHIHRHADQLRDTPVFWTRERRGEDASGWLLFTHKHDYLRATAARLAGAHTVRAFCVPRSEVDGSPPAERVLLALAAALIESYGIKVAVTDVPEYAGTSGFVTDRRTAVVANWGDTDGIWHVDVTDHRPTVREYTDASDHATRRSVLDGATSAGRLRALATYLDLDWPRLVARCRELGGYGLAGIAQPRSRHLSVSGVDRACRYLAASATGRVAG